MKAGLPYRVQIALFLLASVFVSNALARDHLVMGIHPYKSPAKLIQSYTPLAEYLSRKIGIPVRILISKDYQTHINAIGKDQLDIAYMGPASYVSLVDHFGKKPILARQEFNGKSTFQGKIIIRKDSSLTSLSQLKGKSFAFGDPSSTMSHLVPRYMLIKNGVNANQLDHYKFLGSHDNVALAVLSGDYEAGAVKEGVFYKYEKRGLKVLDTTPALSEHLFVASKTLDDATVKKLREAFFALSKDPAGPKIMNSIKQGITAMTAVEDKDYNNLREILNTLKKTGVIK